MWFIILSTEPGAFRLDEWRWWWWWGGQEDNSYQYQVSPSGGSADFPHPCELPSWSDQAQPEKCQDKELSEPPSPEPSLLLSILASGSHVSFKGRQVPVTSGQEVFEEVALGWLRGDPEFSCPLWVSLAAPRPLGQVSPRRGRLAARGRARVDARSASSRGLWLRSVGTRPASGPGRSSNFYLLTKPECFLHLEGQQPLLTHPAS